MGISPPHPEGVPSPVNRIVQPLKDLLDRILSEHQGKRELIYVIALFVVIAGAGYLGGQFGWLHKDVPTSGRRS